MSERLSLALLVCLTLLGLGAIVGVVWLEIDGLQSSGLSAIAGAVVVSLIGLISQWGQSLRPVSDKMDRIGEKVTAVQHTLDDNTSKTEEVRQKVNGAHDALKAELVAAKATISELQAKANP